MTDDDVKDCRPTLQRFAVAMEAKLRVNDYKGGWRSCRTWWLYRRLQEEETELRIAIMQGNPVAILGEAADVANIAMMIADVCGGFSQEERKTAE